MVVVAMMVVAVMVVVVVMSVDGDVVRFNWLCL